MNRNAKDVLDELETYLNSAKYALFSNSLIQVDRVKMEEFVQELRQHIKNESSN